MSARTVDRPESTSVESSENVRDNSQHSAAAAAATAADNTFMDSEEAISSQPSAASVEEGRGDADSQDFESLTEIERISNRRVKLSTPLQNSRHIFEVSAQLIVKIKCRTYFSLSYSFPTQC